MGPVTEPRAVATGPCSLKEFESDKRPVATARGSVTSNLLREHG